MVAWGLFLEVVRQALASLLTTFGVLCMALNAASVYTGTSKQTLLTTPTPSRSMGFGWRWSWMKTWRLRANSRSHSWTAECPRPRAPMDAV